MIAFRRECLIGYEENPHSADNEAIFFSSASISGWVGLYWRVPLVA